MPSQGRAGLDATNAGRGLVRGLAAHADGGADLSLRRLTAPYAGVRRVRMGRTNGRFVFGARGYQHSMEEQQLGAIRTCGSAVAFRTWAGRPSALGNALGRMSDLACH
jgi:hypothetical protein